MRLIKRFLRDYRYIACYFIIVGFIAIMMGGMCLSFYRDLASNACRDYSILYAEKLTKLENELQRIQQGTDMLCIDANIRHLANTINIDNSTHHYMAQAKNVLKKYEYSDTLGGTSFILFRNNHILISSSIAVADATSGYDDILQLRGVSFQPLHDELTQTIRGAAAFMPEADFVILTSPSKKVIPCIFPMPIYSARQTSYLVYMLDTTQLLKQMQDVAPKELSLKLSDRKGETLYTYDAMLSDAQKIKIDGLFFSLEVGLDAQMFSLRTMASFRIYLVVFVFCAIAGIGMFLLLARRNMLRIKRLSDIVNDIERNTSEDMPYERAARELQKMDALTTGYERQLTKMNDLLKATLFEKLLRGEMLEADEEQLANVYFPFLHASFYLAIVGLRANATMESVSDISAQMINAVSLEEIDRNIEDALLVRVYRNKVLVVLPDDTSSEQMRSAFLIVVSRIEQQLPVQMNIVISTLGRRDSLNAMFLSISEALQYCKESFTQLSTNTVLGKTVPLKRLQRLENCLSEGDLTSAEKELNDIFALCQSENTLWTVRHSIENVCASVAEKLGIPYQTVAMYGDTAEIQKSFRHYASVICDSALERKKSRGMSLALSVEAYVRENYADSELNSIKIAEKFGISEKYLFTLMREGPNQSIGALIERIRMQKALTLLAESNMSIHDVAVRCGYNSSDTFSKAFKRAQGIPPRAYRANVENNLDGATSEHSPEDGSSQ